MAKVMAKFQPVECLLVVGGGAGIASIKFWFKAEQVLRHHLIQLPALLVEGKLRLTQVWHELESWDLNLGVLIPGTLRILNPKGAVSFTISSTWGYLSTQPYHPPYTPITIILATEPPSITG